MTLSPAALLDGAIKKLTEDKGELVVSTFLDDAEALVVEGNDLIVKVPSDLVKNSIEQHMAGEINDIISDLAGHRMRAVFLCDPSALLRYEVKASGQLPVGFAGYTFDSFIVGDSNKLAHAAAMAVANAGSMPAGASNSLPIYNPLFIYGQSGLGKTHLLYAIMEMVSRHRFDKKVIYIKGDDFTNEMVESIENGTTAEFRDKYRRADLLLVDDIQFIAGKVRTQEEFFHTFNSLYEAGKQIVLTSDRPPKEIATLEERLTTRFEWGLITDIQPPDLETRMALVNSKAKGHGLNLSADITEYIASNITSNVRQLEGAVKKLAALTSILKTPIDMELAQRAIKDIFKESPGLNPTPELILEEVASFTGVGKDKILSSSKSKEIASARQIAIYIVFELTDLSTTDVGKFFNIHHTSAIYSRDKVSAAIKTDQKLANTVSDLIKNIRSR